MRTTCVRSLAHEQPYWVVQPLVDAGLTAEEAAVHVVDERDGSAGTDRD